MFNVNKFADISEYEHHALFEGIENIWEALGKISAYISSKKSEINCDIPDGAWIENPETVYIGEGTRVERGATIIGPAFIGKNCEIRQGAYLRGNVITGDECVIGHTTEVKNSIFMNESKAAHFAYVGDSILCNGVNLGAGTKLANFKVDTGKRHVSLNIDGRIIETGLRKFGAVIGDNTELGCNSVTMPGTLIGPGTLAYPCTVLRGYIPGNSIIKIRQELQITEKRKPE